MSTGRKIVSDVRGYHKLLSNAFITDRLILSEAKNVGLLLVKRETNLRKLWSTDTIFRTIPCLEMEEVPISSCCEFVDECTISRSKYKLPRMTEGNYQYLIQGVWTINANGGKGKKFKEVNINRLANLFKLPIIKKEMYYWIVDDYLYTNNPLLKSLRIAALFEEDLPSEVEFSDCGCGKTYTDDQVCVNPLDKEFFLPGYLTKQCLDLVSERLLRTHFGLKTDMTDEGIDGQAPNTKPTN